MKKLIITLFAIGVSCSFAYADDFVITGHVPAVADSTCVSLFKFEGRSGSCIAMDTVINGKFRLSGPLDESLTKVDLNLFLNGNASGSRTLYLRPGADVTITATDALVPVWEVKSNVPEQAEYDQFIAKSEDIIRILEQQRLDKDSILNAASSKEEKSTIRAKYKAMRDSMEAVSMFNDIEILQNTPATTVWLDKFESAASLYSIYDMYADSLAMSLKSIYETLDDSAKATEQAERAYVYLFPSTKLKVGDSLPDAIFKDIDGNTHTLAEKRGKWLLLDFWSGGCYPCIMSMPELHEFTEENADIAEVISLSIDGENIWRRSTEIHGVKGNNWNEGKNDIGLYNKFGTNGVPTFALISPDGIIKSIFMGYSKGQFDRELKFHTRAKALPEYMENDGVRTITNPEYGDNQTSAILDIDRIDLSPLGVTLHLSYTYTPGWWFSIDPQAFLTTADGTNLHITSCEGIILGAHTFPDENGCGAFTLTFEPLPADTDRISFIESEDSDWAIRDIRLTK